MHRLTSISLVFLLLVGSVGVTVNRHFCMGELKSAVLFADAEACHTKVTAPVCPMHADTREEVNADDCCNDEHELVTADDDRQVVDAPALRVPIFVAATQPALPLPEFALHLRSRLNKTFQNYRPPPRPIDAPRQFQVFRL